MGPDNFDLVKDFVGDLTNSFTIGADDTQVGVITFSGIARTIFELNTHPNRSVLLEAIGNIPFMDDRGPSTHTADALNLLRVNAFTGEAGARDENLGIPRVAIVVTDGQSNINSSFTIPNAEAAHEAGIQIFAVGVGGSVNRNELEGIASDPLFVSQLSEFTIIEFQGLQRILVYDACIGKGLRQEIMTLYTIEGSLFIYKQKIAYGGQERIIRNAMTESAFMQCMVCFANGHLYCSCLNSFFR